jgi:hypothetical protein
MKPTKILKLGLQKYNKRMDKVGVQNQDVVPLACNLYRKEVGEENFRNPVSMMLQKCQSRI